MNLKEKRQFQQQTDEELRHAAKHAPSKKLKRLAKAELDRRELAVSR